MFVLKLSGIQIILLPFKLLHLINFMRNIKKNKDKVVNKNKNVSKGCN